MGATTLLPYHLNSRIVSINISARDNEGMAGFNEGNRYTQRLWKPQQQIEYDLEPDLIKGPATFQRHETAMLSLEKYTMTGFDDEASEPEIRCYPNPFSKEIAIEINLPEDARVCVEILNQMGQLVKYVEKEKMLSRGSILLKWDGTGENNSLVAPGVYYIRTGIEKKLFYQKILLIN